MQTRSFRGSGEPARVNASSNARFGLGPDPRRALGPAAIRAHQQAGHMTAPDQCCINVKKLLSIRRRPHMTQVAAFRERVTRPIAATIALEMIGPIPGTLIKRSQPTSRRARSSTTRACRRDAALRVVRGAWSRAVSIAVPIAAIAVSIAAILEIYREPQSRDVGLPVVVLHRSS